MKKEVANLQISDNVKLDGNSVQAMDLIWTNKSPTSAFPAQTINLDMSSYKLIVIVVKVATNANAYLSCLITPNDYRQHLAIYSDYNNYRRVTPTATGLVFEQAYYNSTYNVGSVDNTRIIPIAIYGIKTSTKTL